MFVTNWISTTKIQKISEITNFFRHYFLSRTEVFINNFNGLKEKFTYKLADNGDLQVKSKNGSASITFLNDGLYRGQDYFKRIYAPIDYKNCKKYF